MMCKFIFILILNFFYVGVVPPAVVLETFKQKFPSASQVKWSKENAHEYEAEFKINLMSYSANFSDKGLWLETESPIDQSLLPEIIKNSIQQNDKIRRIYKIEKADGTINFELEILKGMKTVEKIFDQDGKLIRS